MLAKRITVEQAKDLHQSGQAKFIDIRDHNVFQAGHIKGATHLNNDSIHSFVKKADKSEPVVVYCYRGNSSIEAAQYLCHQGFEDVSTLEGGFEAWQAGSND